MKTDEELIFEAYKSQSNDYKKMIYLLTQIKDKSISGYKHSDDLWDKTAESHNKIVNANRVIDDIIRGLYWEMEYIGYPEYQEIVGTVLYDEVKAVGLDKTVLEFAKLADDPKSKIRNSLINLGIFLRIHVDESVWNKYDNIDGKNVDKRKKSGRIYK